ncbi:MAG: extracellular solute-binding protein [Patescibacteria group bacterium]
MQRLHIYLVIVLIGVLLTSSCAKRRTLLTNTTSLEQPETITLTYYRWQDDGYFLDNAIAKYHLQHPNVNIAVSQIKLPYYYPRIDSRYDYQEYMAEQIADGAGPDIFEIYHTWVPRLMKQIIPAPENLITAAQFKEEFSSAATDDLVIGGKVYAIPYYIDNLVLFYNPALLAQAGIYAPPATWGELIDMIPVLTRIDKNGTLISSAIALGADQANIPKFADIVATLILQFNGKLTSADHTQAVFDNKVGAIVPGAEALDLYTSFANPNSPNYTYTDATYFMGFRQFPSDVQAFGEEKTAMNVHYSSTAMNIPKMYPNLKFALAPLPQLRSDRPVVLSGYWAETVSRNCAHPEVAWDFIRFVAQEDNPRDIANMRGWIPSLPKLWQEYEKTFLGPVAIQAKYSTTWYQGNDPESVENIFAQAVNNVLHFGINAEDAIRVAAIEVSQIFSITD